MRKTPRRARGSVVTRPGPARRGPARRGLALLWVLLAFALVVAVLAILWSQLEDMGARARRTALAEQARLLARGGLAHGLHKVERTSGFLEDRLKQAPGARLDLAAELPGYLAECAGTVRYQGFAGEPAGTGSYRVTELSVARELDMRGAGVLVVRLAVEATVAGAGQTRAELQRAEYRIFARGGEP